MNVEINIIKVENGWIVVTKNSLKNDGRHVYKATEEYFMLEQIGRTLLGHKIKVLEN